ncbi:unnamed protein product, partial [Heterosigma akashiwo]
PVLVREAGKTLEDAAAEVREAVDFLRYYAAEAERQFGRQEVLPGPTGELNTLSWEGRGPFACIGPWNFPLAIFLGQVAAALAAGNAVVAKAAPQTPLAGHLACRLLRRAGVPPDALQFLPGDADLGQALVEAPELAGVAFTGSTATAQKINRTLAARDGPIAVLVAETGGLNAMIVDSTALPEQAARDAVASAFRSAGQRCSALRLLLLQEEIAPRVLQLVAGAMDELSVGDPALLATDVGPLIDEAAAVRLRDYRASLEDRPGWRVLKECHLGGIKGREQEGGAGDGDKEGGKEGGHPLAPAPPTTFFPPTLVAVPSTAALGAVGEVFGPVLHVATFRGDRLDQTVAEVGALGYGLTFGLHSRLDDRAQRVARAAPAGNVYLNRNVVGAVVGSQPFGGRGLSGTGPKAGGPHYLPRFAVEKVVSENTAARGGNAALLAALGEEE